MTKFGAVLTLLFVVIGFFYAYMSSRAAAPALSDSKRAELEAKMQGEQAPLLYALRDVPEGAVFHQGDIGIKMVESSKIPQGVLSKSDLPKLIGARSRYGVVQNQLIGNHEVKPCPFPSPYLENGGQ